MFVAATTNGGMMRNWFPRVFCTALLVLGAVFVMHGYWVEHYGPSTRAVRTPVTIPRPCSPALIAWAKEGANSTRPAPRGSIPAGLEGFLRAVRRDQPQGLTIEALCSGNVLAERFDITNQSERTYADLKIGLSASSATWVSATDHIQLGTAKLGDLEPGRTLGMVHVTPIGNGGGAELPWNASGPIPTYYLHEQLPMRFAAVVATLGALLGFIILSAWRPREQQGIRTRRMGDILRRPPGQLALLGFFAFKLAVFAHLIEPRLSSTLIVLIAVSGLLFGVAAPTRAEAMSSADNVAIALAVLGMFLGSSPFYATDLLDAFVSGASSTTETLMYAVMTAPAFYFVTWVLSILLSVPTIAGALIGHELRVAAMTALRKRRHGTI